MDAYKSSDPDNDPLKYFWVQLDGPRVKLDNKNSPISTFTAPLNIFANSILIFILTVTDDKKSNSTDDIKVNIRYIPNQSPIANAGTDQTVDAGDTIQFDGSKSNPDGNINSYLWSQIR